MLAKLHTPPSYLASHVEHIWELTGQWVRGEDLLLPDTCIDICVYLDGNCEIHSGRGWTRMPSRLVVGSLTRAVRLRHRGRFHVFGIRLPAGSAQLLGVSAASLRGRLHALSEVSPRLDKALSAVASRSGVGAFRIDEVWSELLPQVGTADLKVIDRALRCLAERPSWAIGSLARELQVSRRQLARRFQAEVGWTPEEFRRLVRFSTATAIAATGPAPRWSDIAVSAGYLDQSHLVRDFKSFVDLTPASTFSADWYSNFAS